MKYFRKSNTFAGYIRLLPQQNLVMQAEIPTKLTLLLLLVNISLCLVAALQICTVATCLSCGNHASDCKTAMHAFHCCLAMSTNCVDSMEFVCDQLYSIQGLQNCTTKQSHCWCEAGLRKTLHHTCTSKSVYMYVLCNNKNNLSRIMRKPTFCICENKDADQLCGNRKADQRLCFRYIDSTVPLLSKSEISSS